MYVISRSLLVAMMLARLEPCIRVTFTATTAFTNSLDVWTKFNQQTWYKPVSTFYTSTVGLSDKIEKSTNPPIVHVRALFRLFVINGIKSNNIVSSVWIQQMMGIADGYKIPRPMHPAMLLCMYVRMSVHVCTSTHNMYVQQRYVQPRNCST